jgi:hypothetical protein
MTTPYKLLVPTELDGNPASRFYTKDNVPQEWTPEEYNTSTRRQDHYLLDPEKWYREQTVTFVEGKVITHLLAPRVGWKDGSSPTLLKRDGVWDYYQIWEVSAPIIPAASPAASPAVP